MNGYKARPMPRQIKVSMVDFYKHKCVKGGGDGRLSLEYLFKQLLHHSFNISILNSTLFTNTTFDVYLSISTNIKKIFLVPDITGR